MSEHVEYEARTVRPYAVTGGRVRSARSDLPLEALVEVMPGAVASTGLTPEKRAIIQHASAGYISVAELSALLHLPLGVVRIIVSDLADANYVRVHTSQPVEVNTGESPALSLSVLESVLNGISAL
ncbi:MULTISPECIES: DUF742 domain-containing protein [Cellulomonas]|jgi:hypothetical protein|uniref:DUF742 domain-containing protein n=1 Tax=Cellulomonas iranensis TaxID=76862 RepID=A0ABU0GJZ6_9CELL|nr:MULTISPECIES: DUF742 domain-containing protein [Cellulomonas]MBO9568274.1 DUF742 domain-containing protein [Cellulomonas iranensis]MDQ0425688.1 hypothetical protein [Cellulomonas iranensis]TFH72037.1 DUF742 domain-containing protein [Cellulomonas sp. HD19AZ1]UCN15124.1 DUF742 domain-containing protein [Cellulomonas iranensis]